MRKRLIPLVLAALLTTPYLVGPAYAWDSVGHMLVAYVAYQQLTPQAKTRANALVRMNPKYSEWVGWVPPNSTVAQKNMLVFMIAATWPDG
jgi:hypothetical protein